MSNARFQEMKCNKKVPGANLYLTRKANEEVLFSYNGIKMKITVSEFFGSKDRTSVRLAIEAPREIKILRGEFGEWNNKENP